MGTSVPGGDKVLSLRSSSFFSFSDTRDATPYLDQDQSGPSALSVAGMKTTDTEVLLHNEFGVGVSL